MASCPATSPNYLLLLICSLQVVVLIDARRSDVSDAVSVTNSGVQTFQRDAKGYRGLQVCQDCPDEKQYNSSRESSDGQLDSHRPEESVGVMVTYTDASGDIKIHRAESRDLSSSWLWVNPAAGNHEPPKDRVTHRDPSLHNVSRSQDVYEPSDDQSKQVNPIDPVKLKRLYLRQKRRAKITAELINMSKEAELQMEAAAIERSEQFDTTRKGKYSIWRREYQNPLSDSTLKLMRDQIIMAKVYASIARSKGKLELYNSLMEHIRDSQHAIGEANSDAELHRRSFIYLWG